MKDVARAADVSLATVSRALKTPDQVKAANLRRIEAAIKETGYVYNAMAADFTRQKNSLVGLIVFTVRSSIQSELIEGVQEELQRNNYSLIVGNSRYDPETEAELLQLFRQRHLAGVIVAESTDDNRDQLRELRTAGIPTVLTWEVTADRSLDCVGIDNYRAAYEATTYLLGCGHRRIGLIAGRFDRIERVRQRYDGYRSALDRYGIAVDPRLTVACTPTPLDGKLAMNTLLKIDDPPTAVFAASDALALGALAAARESGIHVPEDVSIVGFDDLDFAPYTQPPLTTVRVPIYEMGKRAAQLVLEKAGSMRPGENTQVSLDTELVIRGSSGPPRSVVADTDQERT